MILKDLDVIETDENYIIFIETDNPHITTMRMFPKGCNGRELVAGLASITGQMFDGLKTWVSPSNGNVEIYAEEHTEQ